MIVACPTGEECAWFDQESCRSSMSAATWKLHLSSGRKFEQDGFLLLKGFASKDEQASQLTGVLWNVDLSLLSPLELL